LIRIISLQEQRHLIRVNVTYSKDTGFTLSFNSGKGFNPSGRRSIKIKDNSPERFSNFLKKINAFDDKGDARSKRTLSYLSMAYGIINNEDNTIWIWSTELSKIKSEE